MLNQATGRGLSNKTSWLPLSLPFNDINISCYILSCDICFSPTPKKHLSSSPGHSILVLRGFRCIAGKLNTWRNLFVPWSLEEMASLSLQAELGFYRLPPFCSPESPIPHQSSQNQVCIRIHHCDCCLIMKSLLFNIDPHAALAFPLTLLSSEFQKWLGVRSLAHAAFLIWPPHTNLRSIPLRNHKPVSPV